MTVSFPSSSSWWVCQQLLGSTFWSMETSGNIGSQGEFFWENWFRKTKWPPWYGTDSDRTRAGIPVFWFAMSKTIKTQVHIAVRSSYGYNIGKYPKGIIYQKKKKKSKRILFQRRCFVGLNSIDVNTEFFSPLHYLDLITVKEDSYILS